MFVCVCEFVAGLRQDCDLVYFTSFRPFHAYVSLYVINATMATSCGLCVLFYTST